MDANNQLGQAMTKPLPYGCIKKEHTPSLLEFNKILDKISHDGNIAQLFIVDIKFYNKNPNLCCLIRSIHLFLKKIKKGNCLKDQPYSS